MKLANLDRANEIAQELKDLRSIQLNEIVCVSTPEQLSYRDSMIYLSEELNKEKWIIIKEKIIQVLDDYVGELNKELETL